MSTASEIGKSLLARTREVSLDLVQPATGLALRGRLRWIGLGVAGLILLWVVAWGCAHLIRLLTADSRPSRWYVEADAASDGVAVLVHGWTQPASDMEDVAQIIRETPGYENFAVYLFDYDSSRLSNGRPAQVAAKLEGEIRDLYRELPGKEILLVGHSLGGLLIRRAFLNGLANESGFEPEGGVDQPQYRWPKAVQRIVLLATPNRGSRAVFRSKILGASDTLARLLGVGEMIRRTYYGAPFVVNLRLEWIRELRGLDRQPRTVQILGDEDDLVSRDDSRDVLALGDGHATHVAGVNHKEIVRREHIEDPLRRELLLPAAGPLPPEPPNQRTQKVLIVHGIRDYGDRFDKIGLAIQARAEALDQLAIVETPRYRYFSALQFLLPTSREAKLHEFTDLYAELVATPPVDAPVHFVGHSFGTYLVGAALETYEAVNFDRVYLAGSVLEEEYGWRDKLRIGERVKAVRNDRASLDWPVGLLCAAVYDLGLAKLVGTGGFNGFTGLSQSNQFREVAYFQGGHGKALEPANHPTIAQFLIDSPRAPYDHEAALAKLDEAGVFRNADRSNLFEALSRVASSIIALLVAALGYLAIVVRRPVLALGTVMAVLWVLNIL